MSETSPNSAAVLTAKPRLESHGFVLKQGFYLRLEITESQCDFEAIWLRIVVLRGRLLSASAPPWRQVENLRGSREGAKSDAIPGVSRRRPYARDIRT